MHSPDLIRTTYEYFHKTGRWPLVRTLQATYGSAVNVRAATAELGRDRIVCQDGADGTCFLTLNALQSLPEAADDLAILTMALRAIAEKYKREGTAVVTSGYLAEALALAPEELARLGALLYMTRIWTGGSWPTDHSDFSLTPSEDALFFDTVETYDDVIAVQARLHADAQRISQLLAQEYRRVQANPVRPAPDAPARYQLADPLLDDLLQRDLAELERVHGVAAWKATAILAGSCLETLLLDVCQRAEALMVARFKDRWPRRVGAHELLIAAEEGGLINEDIRGLGNALRRWRNLVHPAAARQSREPTKELATALVANLRLLVADLSRHADV